MNYKEENRDEEKLQEENEIYSPSDVTQGSLLVMSGYVKG